MKAVILAGGTGSRLDPLTRVTNKHLLPLYDEPVIYHPIRKLVNAGITRIMIVAAPEHINQFTNLLGSGGDFISKNTGKQIQIVYGIQDKPSGIADGLYVARDYVGSDDVVLYLGDNIIEDDITRHINLFKGGAHVFLKKVPDPERFGIATIDKNARVTKIVEKPTRPESDNAVIGLYMYDNSVYEKMIGQKPSDRGEYEITHVNNKYIEEGTLAASFLEKDWFDIGTFDSLLRASSHIQDHRE